MGPAVSLVLTILLLTLCGAFGVRPSDIRVVGFKGETVDLNKTRSIETVVWYKNDVPITNLLKNNSEFGRKMYLSPSGHLILPGLDLSDRGRYMCVGLDENHQNQSQIYELAVYNASETVPVCPGQFKGQEQIYVSPGQRLNIRVECFNQQNLHNEDLMQARIKHIVRNITEILLECDSRGPSCPILADGVNVLIVGTDITIDGVTNSGQLDGFVGYKEKLFKITINIIVTDYDMQAKLVSPKPIVTDYDMQAKLVSPKPTKTPMHSLGTEIVAGNDIPIYIHILGVIPAVIFVLVLGITCCLIRFSPFCSS